MDFDLLVASVVPAALLGAVKDILVTVGFTSTLASQAWEPWWCGRWFWSLSCLGLGRRGRPSPSSSSFWFGLVLADPQRLDDDLTYFFSAVSGDCHF